MSDRQRDKAIAEWLGWTDIKVRAGAILGWNPARKVYQHVPYYVMESETGPLLEALLRKGWWVEAWTQGELVMVDPGRKRIVSAKGSPSRALADVAYKIATGGQGQ